MPYSSTTSPGCTWSPEVPRHDKLLPGIARTLRPLTDPLAGNPRVLNWSQELQDAIDRAVSLTHPPPSTEVSLVTDASNTHVGAALQQKESGVWCPIAFFSAKLSATQQRYSAFDRELLGVFLALCHFHFELEGRKFHILTDHLPLVSALSFVSPPAKPIILYLGIHQRSPPYARSCKCSG